MSGCNRLSASTGTIRFQILPPGRADKNQPSYLHKTPHHAGRSVGTDLVEGGMTNGRIGELARLDLTGETRASAELAKSGALLRDGG